MAPIPKILTGLLEIKDSKIDKLRNSILKSFDDEENLRAIAAKQCENREQTNCYSCGNEGNCLFLNGILHFKLENIQTAIEEFEIANLRFRSEDKVWNSIIGQAMLGSAHEANEKDHLAFREYQKALDRLTKDYLKVHSTDYIEKAVILKNLLCDQLEYCSSQKKKKQPSKSVKGNTRLTTPWMPRYGGLHAGPNGPTWIDPLPKDNSVLMDEVILDDKPYLIYSLKQGDNLISLTSEKKYGWAKVSGDSMNAAKPVAVLEDDFVLFYESNDANNGAIVIASCPNKNGAGYQFVVKRYSKLDKLLISETEPAGLYDPISITRGVKILGTVIAVAKSAEAVEDGHESQQEHDNAPENTAFRYDELLGLVQGDRPTADSLINYEKELRPKSNKNDWIQRAITSLLLHRRA